MIFPWEREINLQKCFLIHKFKYCSQESDVALELLSSPNNLDFGKENRWITVELWWLKRLINN